MSQMKEAPGTKFFHCAHYLKDNETCCFCGEKPGKEKSVYCPNTIDSPCSERATYRSGENEPT